jgi:hypothetical protein
MCSASPDQLAVLRQIFKDRCRAAGIEAGHREYDSLALRIMSLFESGVQTAEELNAALDGARPHYSTTPRH